LVAEFRYWLADGHPQHVVISLWQFLSVSLASSLVRLRLSFSLALALVRSQLAGAPLEARPMACLRLDSDGARRARLVSSFLGRSSRRLLLLLLQLAETSRWPIIVMDENPQADEPVVGRLIELCRSVGGGDGSGGGSRFGRRLGRRLLESAALDRVCQRCCAKTPPMAAALVDLVVVLPARPRPASPRLLSDCCEPPLTRLACNVGRWRRCVCSVCSDFENCEITMNLKRNLQLVAALVRLFSLPGACSTTSAVVVQD
jgi:hypothetical protein